MKHLFLLLLLVAAGNKAVAQKKWFSLYSDSVALVADGNAIANRFVRDVQKIKPGVRFEVKTVLRTTPYLIFYDENKKTANLPLWSQVMPEQKAFFADVAGSEADGKKAFGYFFNGFYLPHELGHALQDILRGSVKGSYENEYLANTLAILWWRKNGNKKDLKNCYESAKMIWGKLPNPVPAGMTIEDYFLKNYDKASENPYVYGYMQFKQFILIYEAKNLPDFDTFVANYANQK